MASMDWTPNRAVCSGRAWSEPGPNRTGPADIRSSVAVAAVSGSYGMSWPSAKAPGNSGRVCSIRARHEAAAGSHGYTSHARSQPKTDRTVSSTRLIICSRSFVLWVARWTRSMPSRNARWAWRSSSARVRSIVMLARSVTRSMRVC